LVLDLLKKSSLDILIIDFFVH